MGCGGYHCVIVAGWAFLAEVTINDDVSETPVSASFRSAGAVQMGTLEMQAHSLID